MVHATTILGIMIFGQCLTVRTLYEGQSNHRYLVQSCLAVPGFVRTKWSGGSAGLDVGSLKVWSVSLVRKTGEAVPHSQSICLCITCNLGRILVVPSVIV